MRQERPPGLQHLGPQHPRKEEPSPPTSEDGAYRRNPCGLVHWWALLPMRLFTGARLGALGGAVQLLALGTHPLLDG